MNIQAVSAAGEKLDTTTIRQQFPLLANKTYLNSGSYGALCFDVEAAFAQYLTDRRELGADWQGWTEKNEKVRALVAQLLNAHNDEIAITTSASAGVNALASALDFSAGRPKILISDNEFPSCAQIWHAQAARGAEIVHVPAGEDGLIELSKFEELIDERTQLVVVSHVCYRNGAKLDIAGITQLAHAKGAKVLADCYQSAGSELVDVRALGVDFAIGGMLKYLLGTAGIGFLYVKQSLIPALVPTHSGWFAQADIGAMDIYANTPSPTASRFEAGTPPVVNCYAAEAGLRFVLDIGVASIGQRVSGLTHLCMERLSELGASFATPADDAMRGPTVAIRSRDDNELVAALAKHNIVTSCRDGNVRASFHFYNNEEDIEVLVKALQQERGLLA